MILDEMAKKNTIAGLISHPASIVTSNGLNRNRQRSSDPGEIVIMREPRNDGDTGGSVHKLDQTKAEDYLRCLALDKNQLQGIEATRQALHERAQTRQRSS
jgi:hypothetical protein